MVTPGLSRFTRCRTPKTIAPPTRALRVPRTRSAVTLRPRYQISSLKPTATASQSNGGMVAGGVATPVAINTDSTTRAQGTNHSAARACSGARKPKSAKEGRARHMTRAPTSALSVTATAMAV